MARSAPMARPVRSCSWAVFCPIDSSTTSVPVTFSLMRSASSMAISSNGLITHLTLSVTIEVPSGVSLMTVSGSGTRLTGTRIFTFGLSSGGLLSGRVRVPYTARQEQSICGAGAAAEVEAEAARQLATGLHDERRELLLDALGGQAVGGADHGQRADHGARVVADRRGHRAHVLEVLARVDRVAGVRDAAQLLDERLPLDGGALGEAGQPVGQERAERVVRLEGEERLAGRGAVEGQRLAERRDDAYGAVGLDDLDRHDGLATQHRDVGRLAHLADEVGDDRPRLVEEAHVLHVALAELQAADAE